MTQGQWQQKGYLSYMTHLRNARILYDIFQALYGLLRGFDVGF